MIFEPKLREKSVEILILRLFKNEVLFYDNAITNHYFPQSKITVKIRLMQFRLFTKT